MDESHNGFISANMFGRWVKHNCGFEMSESDIQLVQRKFDVVGNNRFERDEIIAAVSPIALAH